MSANPSSTPIAPEGMGPRSVFLLLMLLLGLGAFYWLSHDPNVLDVFSDLKREFDPPAPPAPPPARSPMQAEEEQLRKAADAQMEQLRKDLAEAKGPETDRSPLVFIADPTCAPIGRQWLVSGQVFNSSDKAVRSAKAKITLLIDGEPAEEQTVEVGPIEPQRAWKYQALFRPARNTRHHTVTATASWER